MRVNGPSKRRGAITPLAAFAGTVLVGMVAFAVDLGWIAVVRSDLQNAADAAALAGANQLMEGHVTYYLPGQSSSNKSTVIKDYLSSARTKAKEFAKHNSAGGVAALTLLDTDIEFGFLEADGTYTAVPTYTGFPNTIKVTMRRDSTANGELGLFFARVFGRSNTDVQAKAASSLYTGRIDSFKTSSFATGLLPVTYDQAHWHSFLKGENGDATTDANGNPQILVYPSIKYKGNFGQLSLSDANIGTSVQKSWVDNGVPSSDIQTLLDHNLIPLSKHDANTWDWEGSTGKVGSLMMDINQYANKTFVLPLFKAKSTSPYNAGEGKGSNYNFNIVEFVAVKIMPVDDKNKEIVVQPSAAIEPNAVFASGSIVLAGTTTESQQSTTFTYPKLTQ